MAKLSAQGKHMQRRRVRERVNPESTQSRWSQLIKRRSYSVPSPNSLWHIDGQHSLIRWRMVIHGCIDGFSRLVLYVNCNRSDTVLQLFTAATREYGLPSRVHSDKGGENFGVCEYMIRNRGTSSQSQIEFL